MAMMRLAMEQASESALSLPLDVADAQRIECTREGLSDHLRDGALFAVLEGQVPGFLAMDLPVMGGIVEHLTIGRILSASQPDRRPTRVDAALVAPFVDAALHRFGQAAQSAELADWGQGVGFGAMVPDARALLLALPVRGYQVLSFQVRLCGGQREGMVSLGFGELPEAEVEAVETDAPLEGRKTVRSGVLSSPATLDAVIARIGVPLKELQALKLGDTLHIPADALAQTRLEAMGGDHAFHVHLGQLNGFRAVRLRSASRSTQVNSDLDDPLEAAAIEMPAQPQVQTALSTGTDVVTPGEHDVRTQIESAPETGSDDLDALLDEAETGDLLTPV